MDCVLNIIATKIKNNEKIAVVVSARGKTTNHLDSILEKAKNSLPYLEEFELVKNYQLEAASDVDLSFEFQL